MTKACLKLYSENKSDRKEIRRYLGVRESDPELDRLIEECIDECKGVSKFSCAYTVTDIEVKDNLIATEAFSVLSSDLAVNLNSCTKAVIFAATTGIGIDRLISKYSVVSPVKAVIFQAIGAERIESLCDMFNEDMRREYEKEGYLLKPRFSPGYGDLSLETQKDIFSLLECEKRLGITLGNNLLMSPSKSVTAFIGIYRK